MRFVELPLPFRWLAASVLAVVWTSMSALAFGESQPNTQGDYVAVSLKGLEKEITVDDGRASRVLLLGMSSIRAAIVDGNSADVILVGDRDDGDRQLTSDDVGALIRTCSCSLAERITFSLESKGGDPRASKLVPVFRGSIASNIVGSVAFRADYLMKKIALGVVPIGVAGIPSYAQRLEEFFRDESSVGGITNINSRFWFEPTLNPAVFSGTHDVVVVGDPLIRVNVETLSVNGCEAASDFTDPAAAGYARDFNENWAVVCKVHPDIAALQRVSTAIALFGTLSRQCSANATVRSRLAYWTHKHRSSPVAIPAEVDRLERPITLGVRKATALGGVRLGGLSVRMRQIDPAGLMAFKAVVLATRPHAGALQWTFTVDDSWHVSGPAIPADVSEIARLYGEGLDAYVKGEAEEGIGHFAIAIDRFRQVVDRYPDSPEPRLLLALAQRDLSFRKGSLNEILPQLVPLRNLADAFPDLLEARYEVARTLFILGRAPEAIPALLDIVMSQPDYAPAQQVLGLAYRANGDSESAKKHLSAFLQIPGQPAWLVTEAKNALSAIDGKGEKSRPAFDPTHRIRFGVPDSWRRLTLDEMKRIPETGTSAGELLMVYRHPDDPDNSVNVRVQDVGADTMSDAEIRDALQYLDAMYRQTFKGYVRMEAEQILVAAAKGLRIKYSCDRAGARITHCVVTLVKNRKMLTITFTAKEPQFDQCWEECFGPALESMTWGDSESSSAGGEAKR